MAASEPVEAPKFCYECRYFNFSPGSPGYSSWTPGSDLSFGCMKNIWSGFDILDESDFASKIKTAETCEKFEGRPAR